MAESKRLFNYFLNNVLDKELHDRFIANPHCYAEPILHEYEEWKSVRDIMSKRNINKYKKMVSNKKLSTLMSNGSRYSVNFVNATIELIKAIDYIKRHSNI